LPSDCILVYRLVPAKEADMAKLTTSLTVRLSPELRDKMDRVAGELGQTITTFLTRAIEAAVEKKHSKSKPKAAA
jgi:uncharacterized protein (DUF1778 family)